MATRDEDGLAEKVRQVERRRSAWRRDGERNLGRNLAMVGVLGWLVVGPMLVGILLGRWLDRSFESGVFWTGAGIVVGLALGCWLGWRWMHEQ